MRNDTPGIKSWIKSTFRKGTHSRSLVRLSGCRPFSRRWRLRPAREHSRNICCTWVTTSLWRPAWRWSTSRARPLSGPSSCSATGSKQTTACPAESVRRSKSPLLCSFLRLPSPLFSALWWNRQRALIKRCILVLCSSKEHAVKIVNQLISYFIMNYILLQSHFYREDCVNMAGQKLEQDFC